MRKRIAICVALLWVGSGASAWADETLFEARIESEAPAREYQVFQTSGRLWLRLEQAPLGRKARLCESTACRDKIETLLRRWKTLKSGATVSKPVEGGCRESWVVSLPHKTRFCRDSVSERSLGGAAFLAMIQAIEEELLEADWTRKP